MPSRPRLISRYLPGPYLRSTTLNRPFLEIWTDPDLSQEPWPYPRPRTTVLKIKKLTLVLTWVPGPAQRSRTLHRPLHEILVLPEDPRPFLRFWTLPLQSDMRWSCMLSHLEVNRSGKCCCIYHAHSSIFMYILDTFQLHTLYPNARTFGFFALRARSPRGKGPPSNHPLDDTLLDNDYNCLSQKGTRQNKLFEKLASQDDDMHHLGSWSSLLDEPSKVKTK